MGIDRSSTSRSRRRWRRALLLFGALFVAYGIYAQIGMKMRVTDKSAIKEFAELGLSLHFHDFPCQGIELHYAQTGSDTLPTVLFVHGSPGSWDAFAGFLKDSLLAGSFRLISVDRPGFGYSSFGTAYSLPMQGSAIGALAAYLQNGKPMHLVGHSLGGPVVLWVAQHKPTLISHTLILAGSISAKYEPAENWRRPMAGFPLKYLVPGVLGTSNREILDFKGDLAILDTGYQYISSSICFMHGDKDGLVPVENARYGMEMMEGRANADTLIIKGGSHFLPWEYFDQVRDFLVKLPKEFSISHYGINGAP